MRGRIRGVKASASLKQNARQSLALVPVRIRGVKASASLKRDDGLSKGDVIDAVSEV